jgi:hypothetical protein
LEYEGSLLASGAQEAQGQAGGALLFLLDQLLAEVGRPLSDVRLFATDVGPGSFTGVKVCVTLAKSMALARGVDVAGVSAFDLVSREAVVAVPSRKSEWFVRVPGSKPTLETSVPMGALGYGAGFKEPAFPHAENAEGLELAPIRAEVLVPAYIAAPSISQPRDRRLLGGPDA